MVLLGVWNSNVLSSSLHKLCTTLLLKISAGPINFGLLEVLVELELIEFLLLELLEGVLDGLLGFQLLQLL